jgi:hypothetical protein
MAKYSVNCFCNECGETHPTGIVLGLNDGPVSKDSINNTYDGKPLPQEVAKLRNNKFTCTTKGVQTIQKDNDQIFLVAISN